jgi:hypothetical protein
MTSPYPRRADDFFLSRRADPGAARRVRRHGDPAPSEVPKFLLPHEAVGQVDTVMLAGYLAALAPLLFAPTGRRRPESRT